MSASTDLATLADVKEYLGISTSDNDTLLESLIDSASEAIEHYCRRKFALAERTEQLDGSGAQGMVLSCRPVDSIASIHLDASREFASATLLDDSGYTFYPQEGIVRLDAGVFPRGIRNVRIVYTAGYADVPPAIAQAAKMLVAHFFNRGAQRGDGIESERAGSYTVSYDTSSWPLSVKALLAEYRETGL